MAETSENRIIQTQECRLVGHCIEDTLIFFLFGFLGWFVSILLFWIISNVLTKSFFVKN